MVIGKHVSEFAGFPVEEYDPAVGILLPVMPRRVFRSSDQVWAITLEKDRLTIESGPSGTEGKAESKKFPNAEKARADYRKRIQEKVAAGYVLVLPRREYQLIEGTSAKFWAIEVLDDSYTVQFGRIGTAGQTQVKEFDSAAGARRAAEKIIAEKVGKGYTEVGARSGSLLAALCSALQANPDDRASRNALADYLAEQGLLPLPVAYRVNGDGTPEALEAILADPFAGLVQALVVGFCFDREGEGSGEAVKLLVNARERLPNLRALFLGDISYHDREISWLIQSDLTGLLTAFAHLEQFRARGGG